MGITINLGRNYELKDLVKTEEILQHWGIKGMKWKKKKGTSENPEPIPKSGNGLVDNIVKGAKDAVNEIKSMNMSTMIGPLKVDLPVIAAAGVAVALTASMPIVVTAAATVGAVAGARLIVDKIDSYRGRRAIEKSLKIKMNQKPVPKPKSIPKPTKPSNDSLRIEIEKRQVQDMRRKAKPMPARPKVTGNSLLNAMKRKKQTTSAKQFNRGLDLRSKLRGGRSSEL